MDKDLLLHISNCFCTHCCGLNKKMDCDHTNRSCQQLYKFLVDCKNYEREHTTKIEHKTAIYTFENKKAVENEIDALLKAQPDAQILSVFADNGLYRVVVRRHYGRFID